ncbi:MAG TPA: FtsX-like permease family protein, partial [Steroidobacteraceae bacterium]|nr:FtsX-like permease family protein [Steroidobacteraceae bacterium]
ADGAAVREFFATRGLPPTELVPLVRARLAAVNGVPVDKLHFESDRAQGFVEREANLTWSRALRDDNRIVAGRWWSDGDGGDARVSVEKEYAERLGLKLGDTLTYDVAGEPVSARITSLRDVRWDSFQPNFFVVFSPGVLEGVTGTLITSVHVDRSQRPLLVDLVRRFPEVTIIDIDALLTQVREVMDKAALAVQYVFAFTLAAGVMVLLAAVQATRDERHFESAILRTLGASRRVVFAGVAAEFVVLGLLAGVLAAAGASIAGYFLAREIFDLKYSADPAVWIAGVAGGALLVGVAGVLAARSAVTQPPVATLRQVQG